jgi:hypothetical protein
MGSPILQAATEVWTFPLHQGRRRGIPGAQEISYLTTSNGGTRASEPLLLYIAATLEVVSMVLLEEWPDPHSLHELGSSSTDGSGSQDPGPAEELGAIMAAGSQSPKAAAGPHD